MICKELTRYIDAFLDDELSVMENLRVQAHVAFCGNCRAIVKSEITLRSLIEADALQDSAPGHLREKILCQISEPPQQRPSGGFGRWTFLQRGFFAGLMAGAVAMALVFSLGVYLLKTSSGSISPLVAEMVGKHQMYSRSEASLQVKNSDHHGVDSWLRQRVAFPLRVPVLGRSGELIGARVSSVGDRQAAYLLYEINGRRISVYVFESFPNDNLSGSSKVTAGTEFFFSNFDGFPVVWWENQELYYAAVSDHSANDLVEFGLLCVKAMGL